MLRQKRVRVRPLLATLCCLLLSAHRAVATTPPPPQRAATRTITTADASSHVEVTESMLDPNALRYQQGRNLTDRVAWRTSLLEKEDNVFGSYARWSSVEASAGAYDVSLNTIVGSVRAGSLHAAPFAWAALLSGRAEHTSYTPTAEYAGAFIGTAFVRLEEIEPDSNDRVVSAVDLGEAQWTDIELLHPTRSSSSSSSSNNNSNNEESKDAQYLNVARTRFKGRGVNCTLTIVASSIGGVLEYGSAPVSPNTLETILDISGFAYASAKNRLRLVLSVVSSRRADSSGTAMTVPVARDASKLYSAVAPWALVDGSVCAVGVSSLRDGTLSSNSVFASTVTNVFGTNYQARVQHVDFPAGAAHIIYDPALGYGNSTIYGHNASHKPRPPLWLWLLVVLLLLTASAHQRRLRL